MLPSEFECTGTPAELALDLDDLLFSSSGLVEHDMPLQASCFQHTIDQFRWHSELCEEATSTTASEAAGPPHPAPPAPGAGAAGGKAAGKVQRRAEQNR